MPFPAYAATVIHVRPAASRALEAQRARLTGVHRDQDGEHGYDPVEDIDVTTLAEPERTAIPREPAAGALARYSEAQQKDEAGGLRASLRLRLAVRPGGGSESEDAAGLQAVMKLGLAGTQLRFGKGSAVVAAGGGAFGTVMLGRELATIGRDISPSVDASTLTMAGSIGASHSALLDDTARSTILAALRSGATVDMGEITSWLATTLGDSAEFIKDAVTTIFENAPLVGVVVNGLKVIAYGVNAALDTLDLVKYRGRIAQSISVVQTRLYEAAEHYAADDILMSGQEIARSLVKGVAAGFGASVVVGPADALLGLGIKVIRLINEYLLVKRANAELASGAVSAETLKSCPQLALYLPFLPGMDPFSMLGIMPPGWTLPGRRGSPAETRLLSYLREPGNQELLEELGKVSAASEGSTERVAGHTWSLETGAIGALIETANKYLYPRDYSLFRGDKLVHDPSPVGFVQRIKAFLKRVGLAVLEQLKLIPAWVADKVRRLVGFIGRSLRTAAGAPATSAAPVVTYTPVVPIVAEEPWQLVDFDDADAEAA